MDKEVAKYIEAEQRLTIRKRTYYKRQRNKQPVIVVINDDVNVIA